MTSTSATYIYNAVSWTAEKLISDIRRKAKIPASSDYSDEVILDVANESIWTTLSLPELTNDGGYWGQSFTHQITGANDAVAPVTGVAPDNRPGSVHGAGREYELPPAVAAGAIKFVTYKEPGGREWQLQHLPLTDFFDIWANSENSGTTWAYCLWENKLKVLPAASSSLDGTFQIYYNRRHPQVMKFEGNFLNIGEFTPALYSGGSPLNQGRIEAVEGQTIPTWWPQDNDYSCGVDGDGVESIFPFRWDIIGSVGPHSHRVVDMDYYSSNIIDAIYRLQINREQYPLEYILPGASSPAFPFLEDDKRPVIGTFVLAAAGTSPYVHLPHELTEACALQAAASILRDIGSIEEAATYDNRTDKLILRVQNQMAPRVKNAPLKVVNPSSIVRSTSNRGRRSGNRGGW